MSLKETITTLAGEYLPEVIKHRRHFHAHPELAFEETQTAAYIVDFLQAEGIEYTTGVAKTGIVGYIRGNNPEGKTIALRADMDALPIVEENDVTYKSQADGKMHACGHDAHSASLMGAVKILNQLKEEFNGTVKLIFQPSEEKLPGGASVMIREGVLENPAPQSMFGQHVYPDLEVGKVGFRPGLYMASTDEIYMTVKGKGGHAALPHKLVDPVLITSHLMVALQQLVSRNCPPTIPSVLSFGRLEANGATNIIPDEVNIQGTFRTMDEGWRSTAHNKITELANGLVESMGGTCSLEIRKGYPHLRNDEALTMNARQWAREYLGAENVVDLDLRMTAEDFAYFSQELPVCFYRFGVRNESKGITSGLHTSRFNIDENALLVSTGLLSWLAIKELQH